MIGPVLHHFDASPFGEKVRLALGLKGLAWHSVQIPMIPPRPQLVPLNGGYRRTPTLQIGAEVYCDTRLILPELDRRYPERPLLTPEIAGLGGMVQAWSDGPFFAHGATLSLALNEQIPEPLLRDRAQMFPFVDEHELSSVAPHAFGQFVAQVELLEQQLADGRQYLGGAAASMLDVVAYHPLWMARANIPGIEPQLAPFANVAAWLARLDQVGHGEPHEMDAADALALARANDPSDDHAVASNPQALQRGATVTVAPTDYGVVPVAGTLIGLTNSCITLRRDDPGVGQVNTHFPRIGFRIDPT